MYCILKSIYLILINQTERRQAALNRKNDDEKTDRSNPNWEFLMV